MAACDRNGGINIMQGEYTIETATCYTKHNLIIWNRQIRSFKTLLDENVLVERERPSSCATRSSWALSE